MKKFMKIKGILRVVAILFTIPYLYVYWKNPLEKEFNLGDFGVFFPLGILIFQLLLWKCKCKFSFELSLMITSLILFIYYLVFL